MNKNLIFIIGGGLLLYLWLQKQQQATAGTTTGATGTSPGGTPSGTFRASGGGTATSPQIGDEIWGSTGMVAVYDGSHWHSPPLTSAEINAVTQQQIAVANQTMGPPPGGTTTTIPPAATGGMSLASLYQGLLSWAAKDQQFSYHDGDWYGLPYHWNFYVQYQMPNPPAGHAGTWPPDVNVVFPGIDVNVPISSTAFWAGMGPALRQGFGLSGLGRIRSAWFNNMHGGWAA